MEIAKLREKLKEEKSKSLKESGIRQATVWSADTADGFKDFMKDEDLIKDRAFLRPHRGAASNLIYQVTFYRVFCFLNYFKPLTII
jgi:hypothetical protein